MNIPNGQTRAVSNQTGMPELVVENPDIVEAEFKRASPDISWAYFGGSNSLRVGFLV